MEEVSPGVYRSVSPPIIIDHRLWMPQRAPTGRGMLSYFAGDQDVYPDVYAITPEEEKEILRLQAELDKGRQAWKTMTDEQRKEADYLDEMEARDANPFEMV